MEENPYNCCCCFQTVIQAYSIGVVLTYYDQVVVLQALFLTVTVVLGLSAYTFQTKRDFSSFGFGCVPLNYMKVSLFQHKKYTYFSLCVILCYLIGFEFLFHYLIYWAFCCSL